MCSIPTHIGLHFGNGGGVASAFLFELPGPGRRSRRTLADAHSPTLEFGPTQSLPAAAPWAIGAICDGAQNEGETAATWDFGLIGRSIGRSIRSIDSNSYTVTDAVPQARVVGYARPTELMTMLHLIPAKQVDRLTRRRYCAIAQVKDKRAQPSYESWDW